MIEGRAKGAAWTTGARWPRDFFNAQDLSFPLSQGRAAAMGTALAAGSSGFIVGPLIGGYLADMFGMRLLCYLTAAIFLLNGLLAALFLPHHTPKLLPYDVVSDSPQRNSTASPFGVHGRRPYNFHR